NAVECLDRLGILDRVKTAGATEVDLARIRAGGVDREVPLRRRGLGISRAALDEIVAKDCPVEQGSNVQSISRTDNEFVIRTNLGEFRCPVLIDAAGKLSRFSKRSTEPEFGIQYVEKESRGSALDFWFFGEGYGGGVTVEKGDSNFCFLIK